MKILTAEQTHLLDRYTIQHEPVSNIDLMERAAKAVAHALYEELRLNEHIYVFCGRGNNGGDGLAIARLLLEHGFLHVFTYAVAHSPRCSEEYRLNEQRLKEIAEVRAIETVAQIPDVPKGAVVIDAILGSGLARPVSGLAAQVIEQINAGGARIYSVDVPSGMYGDRLNEKGDVVVNADEVFTFHAPKLSFLLPASASFMRGFRVLDIGLDKDYATSMPSPYHYLTTEEVNTFFHVRNRFSHKGTYGHALLAAGSYGKMGAAVLSTQAALRSGAGLITACVPRWGSAIMQVSCPEAMVLADKADTMLSEVPDTDRFNAVAVGPGIGTAANTKSFLETLVTHYRRPMVLDADALNLLADNKNLLRQVPPGSVLTPHPGEFKRLAGAWKDDNERLTKQIDFARLYGVVVVLKGAHTSIAFPDGTVYFNSTGNPGMAKGGSGDVLTGVLVALLAQQYTPQEAALLGVFVHGVAGDCAAADLGQTAMTSGDLIRHLPAAFKQLEK